MKYTQILVVDFINALSVRSDRDTKNGSVFEHQLADALHDF